jgi:hypothetical protein
MAPFGRAVIYGAKNAHDSFPTETVRQLIFKNQSVTGFNSHRCYQGKSENPYLL